MPDCPICEAELGRGRASWLLRCRGCGFEQSTLAVRIGDPRSSAAIDEAARAQGLNALRERNFQRIVGVLDGLRERRGSLLDVGCAHGWFLRQAAASGWKAVGIEPDVEIARVAARSGTEVRVGMFPGALKPGERFDVIIFNDVFEHLPDVHGALRACVAALEPGGLLAINLPDTRGTFYRLACLLARARWFGPLSRLWQVGFASPHVSYFTGPLLRRLAEVHGFRPVYSAPLPSVALRGLWSRLRLDRNSRVLASALVWAGTCLLWPALRVSSSDISLEIFQLPAGRR